MKEYFSVNVSHYVPEKDFLVFRPASLNVPKSQAVMFIMEKYIDRQSVFATVEQCLIFWPESIPVPQSIRDKHAVFVCEKPHTEYCVFFRDNGIVSRPPLEEYEIVNGAYISKFATLGDNVIVMPGVYIGGECVIGNDVYIGCGTKIVGDVHIGDRVAIRENCVIGTDATTTDRISSGEVVSMPQFGNLVIEEDVLIGANTVIARGAIDATVIRRGVKIGMGAVIGHNTDIGEDSIIVGGAIMAGSSSVGKQSMVSFNASIRNFVHIGDHATVGMGSVVTRDVPNGVTVKGNPAK